MNGDRQRVLMLVSNPFRPDPRVAKEAATLARFYDVRIWAMDMRCQLPRKEKRDGYVVERVHLHLVNRLFPLVKELRWIFPLVLLSFYLRSLKLLFARYDIVHAHDLDMLPLGFILAKLKRKRLIFDAHEDFAALVMSKGRRILPRVLLSLERWLMNRADAVIVVGEIMREEYAGRTKTPLFIVSNWATRKEIDEGHRHAASLGLENKWSGKLVVGQLGGIQRSRIIRPLIEAAAETPEVQVIVAGGRPGDPLAEELKSLSESIPNVLFTGWLSKEVLGAYLHRCDVVYYCLNPDYPNNRYSSSNSIYAALLAGKAVITTALGETGRIVEENRCGIVMAEATKSEVLAAFDELKDPSMLAEYQANARRVGERFVWEDAAATLLELYEKVTARKLGG